MLSPTKKNVAFTSFFFRISKISGVYFESGPSSNVNAIVLTSDYLSVVSFSQLPKIIVKTIIKNLICAKVFI